MDQFLRHLFTGAVLISALASTGQTGIDTPHLFLKNHFSYALTNSFTRATFENTVGTEHAIAGIGYVHQVDFKYQFNRDKHFAIGLSAGGGLYPLLTYMPAFGTYKGTRDDGYFMAAWHRPFVQCEVDFTYRLGLGKRLILAPGISFGARFFEDNSYLRSWGNSNGFNYLEHVGYSRSPKNLVKPQLAFLIPLKNKDLLGINVNFVYSLRQVFTGTFTMYSNTSQGYYYNKGHTLGIGIQYHFTRAFTSMDKQIERQAEKENKWSTRKEQRPNTRFIHPKSMIFGFGFGIFYTRPKFDQEVTGLISSPAESMSFHADFQKGIKNNFFMEARISAQEYTSDLLPEAFEDEFAFNMSPVHEFGGSLLAGAGYHWINPETNYNYITFSGGLGSLFLFNDKGYTGYSGGGSGWPMDENYYAFKADRYTERKSVPLAWLTVSKDFRLNPHFLMALAWNYQQGFITSAYSNVFYTVGNTGETTFVRQIMDGTSNNFSLTLRYLIQPKE